MVAHKAGKDRPVTTSLGPEPSYCKIHLVRPLTPSQWMTCWKYGWNEPTSTLMARIGHDAGHNVLPVLIILAIIVFVGMRIVSRA
jgi:hypothetical protein